MGRYELNNNVVILQPFGDGKTVFQITAVQGINSNGEISETEIEYYQYEIDGTFYAEQYIGQAK